MDKHFLLLGFLRGAVISAVLICIFSAARGIYKALKPVYCHVCGNGEGRRHHAPCVLALSTGQMIELEVYDPHPSLAGELAEEQQRGTLSFVHRGELTAIRDSGAQTCTLYLPEDAGPMGDRLFCSDCEAILTEIAVEGYVLLDLYDLDSISAYPISDGAEYAIRCYTVSVDSESPTGHTVLQTTGHLFDE